MQKHGPKAVQRELAKLEEENPGITALAKYCWEAWARPSQLPPPGWWLFWFIMAGRGYGKSRTAAEWIRSRVYAGFMRIGFAGPTDDDIEKKMIEDPDSGILSVFPPNEKPRYWPGKHKVTFHTGAEALLYSAIKPRRGRGAQLDTLWCDEIASWRYQQEEEDLVEGGLFDMLLFGLRVGDDPRGVISSTPKSNRITKRLLNHKHCKTVIGTTYENMVNLSPAYQLIIEEFEGTRLGMQELLAKILDDNPKALWKRAWIERDRVSIAPKMKRIGIGVDPPGSTAECGIVAAGLGVDNEIYVIGDYSIRGRPGVWGDQVIGGYTTLKADKIIGEKNFGGDMVEHTIETAAIDPKTGKPIPVSYLGVSASRGKAIRADPISTLYEKVIEKTGMSRVHHVGTFPELEDQLCEWEPGDKSPDRLDALVWVVTYLSTFMKKRGTSAITSGIDETTVSNWGD